MTLHLLGLSSCLPQEEGLKHFPFANSHTERVWQPACCALSRGSSPSVGSTCEVTGDSRLDNAAMKLSDRPGLLSSP